MKLDVEMISKSTNQKIRLRDYNVFPQDVVIKSIEQKDFFDTVDGSNKRIYKGTQDVSRVIEVPFFTHDPNPENFPLIRDDIFSLFGAEEFYIREMRDGDYATGKQYLVKLTNVIQLNQKHIFSEGKLILETTDMPYAESIETTLTIDSLGIRANGNWSVGMNLQSNNDKELTYTFNTTGQTRFEVYNAGNVEVHPFESYLKIILRNVVATGSRVSIVNYTNGTRIDINEKTEVSAVWMFDGAIIRKNSLNATHITNRTFLSLSKGVNSLAIVGATSATINFDFKYLYR